jgi:hypothetical protein
MLGMAMAADGILAVLSPATRVGTAYSNQTDAPH